MCRSLVERVSVVGPAPTAEVLTRLVPFSPAGAERQPRAHGSASAVSAGGAEWA